MGGFKSLFLQNVEDLVSAPKVLVVAIQLPNGAIEIITNHENLEEKINYYKENYDTDFRLKHNRDVKVINWMIH